MPPTFSKLGPICKIHSFEKYFAYLPGKIFGSTPPLRPDPLRSLPVPHKKLRSLTKPQPEMKTGLKVVKRLTLKPNYDGKPETIINCTKYVPSSQTSITL